MSEQLRAYRYALDLTEAQASVVAQHAGAARWAYNHALAAKFGALDERQAAIKQAVESGADPDVAAKQAPKIPTKPNIQKSLNRAKGDDRVGQDGLCPWWHTVSTHALQSAFIDADRAWKNWLDSITGRRSGRRVGRPRFKAKHRSRDSFRIHHDVKKPTIRPDTGYRRIIVPRVGSVRVHSSTKPLCRALARGAVIQSITISRGGHRWNASVLVKHPATEAPPTRAQRQAGTVGVDLGVHSLAALSTGETIDNPRHLNAARTRLLKAQRALSRTKKGSNRRRRAARLLGRRHHEVSERRASTLHAVTKKLATEWSTIAIEDLNVAGMTSSARGTVAKPGRNVKAKAGLNRAILDTAPGEFRRQLTYKTGWHGSKVVVIDRFYPSSQTCLLTGLTNDTPAGLRKLTLAAGSSRWHGVA
ncbi:RNA-guided endonuclease InsQ/TnpB family protein [Mycolicibacterium fortuitum]|uniref:RNA-guided endonuclease TnpB family protein n=2 Tax=Mycolicibacterium fortuitum TaxID=1766 RepID=A0AAE4VGL6_MYCFO|nr:transposase [Mycolicibacterium fortuitum]MDV7194488.1 RNA-guided endonuclease TnpB family protein [Mycolicibacterium fortuitum]MDV7207882.1 RNA-guided endonuclease TnpB family protein [Mycolicibacterium fortuitum]MDV7229180.1 RNA-guided endonuclease TnpB family protein [Mycolicibacterium fortuitum]MDV7260879.1 RNA-guided endonuclease TnpB family protein [Mycolicibacterium fortuitum]MDV7285888.1 RNA-guided endonuclease TnpB family protein [Mycolicibacterium fortuitum]